MPRLIDANALIAFIRKGWRVFPSSELRHTCDITDIESAPTIDAVEVVRCKDCGFFVDEDEYGNCYCCEWGNVTNANGYCHDSERKRKMSKNNNSTYLCDEYQDLIEIRRWCAIFGAVQLVSLILFAIACAL